MMAMLSQHVGATTFWLNEHPGWTGSGGILAVLSVDYFNRYAAALIAVLTIITLLPKAGRVLSRGARAFRDWASRK